MATEFFDHIPGRRLGANRVRAVGEAADANANQRVKLPCRLQLHQHPVDAVGRFVSLFEEQDGVSGIDFPRCPEARNDEFQRAAGKPAFPPTRCTDLPTMRWGGPTPRSVVAIARLLSALNASVRSSIGP